MKEIGHLRIEILAAELTRGEEHFSGKDPYVICETSDIRIRTLQQRIKESYLTPKWNQYFNLNPKTVDDEMMLMVFDEDVDEHDIIGGC